MRSISASLSGAAATALLCLWTGAAAAGPTPGGPDSDSDGVENAFDNCTQTPNPSQTDSDHNGCGDACTQPITCDVNGDKTVGLPDCLVQFSNFGMSVPTGTLGDCDPPGGDGLIGIPDFLAIGREFGHTVGPSGITSAACDPSTCRCTPQ